MNIQQSNKTINDKELSSVFSNYPQIAAVYLFGSYAKGNQKKKSDIDLAITGRDLNEELKLSLLTDLAKHGYCNVDLIFLDKVDLVTRYEAVYLNKIIYSTPGYDHGSFYSKIIRQYFDFYPFLEIQRAAYKNRLLNG